MDIFEQWMNSWIEKNIHERKLWAQENLTLCSCTTCPSYNRCAHDRHESLYCITGKSMLCITEDLGCICKTCRLVPELGLKYHDFCMKGGESAQRYEHEQH